MDYGETLADIEEALMEIQGQRVEIKSISTGEPVAVDARFWVRTEGGNLSRDLPHGGRGVREQRWAAVLAGKDGLGEQPLTPGDLFIRPHGPKLKVLAGGKTIEAADGRAVAYHAPVAEVA